MRLGRREAFSLFVPQHRKLAARLIDIFLGLYFMALIQVHFLKKIINEFGHSFSGMRSYEDFVSAAVFARDRVNPFLFIYALSVAIIHRPDTKNIQLPPLYENFPEKYMDGGIFKRAREVSNVLDAQARVS